MNFQEAYAKLEAVDQLHVLKYYEELSEEEKEALLAQVAATDFSVIEACKKENLAVEKGVISPLAAMELSEIEEKKAMFEKLGVKAIQCKGDLRINVGTQCAIRPGWINFTRCDILYVIGKTDGDVFGRSIGWTQMHGKGFGNVRNTCHVLSSNPCGALSR